MQQQFACKACGSVTDSAKDRRPLNGKQYNSLFSIATARNSPPSAKSVHSFLAKSPSYVCKPCYLALTKYGSIAKEIEAMQRRLKDVLAIEDVSVTEDSLSTSIQLGKRSCSCEVLETAKRMKPQSRELHSGHPRKVLFPVHLNNSPQASPDVTVVVSDVQRNHRFFYLSRSLKKIGKYVGRGKKRSIAEAVVQNITLRNEVVTALGTAVRKEIRKICSDSHDSILRMKTKTALELFSWERVWLELQMHAPLLVAFFTHLLSPSKRKAEVMVYPAFCVCASIFWQLHNKKINLVQAMIAVVLKAGHATKQVFTRLNHLHLCTTHKTLLNVLDEASVGHDEKVHDWQDAQNKTLSAPQLPVNSEIVMSVLDLEVSCNSMGLQSPVVFSPEAPPYSPICTYHSAHSPSAFDDTSDSHTSHPPNETSPVSVTRSQFSPLLTPQAPPNSSTPVGPFPTAPSEWSGFKIVLDNIDMNIRPRHQTFECQTQSIHYVNSYAVKDRIDFSSLENTPVNTGLEPELLHDAILPSASDHEALMANFVILAGRILCEAIPALSDIPGLTTEHIHHSYYREMSAKSDIVPLGIIMKNENKTHEMVSILSQLHQYVPMKSEKMAIHVPCTGDTEEVHSESLHHLLVGGDQLTAERIRGAQNLRKNSTTATGRLDGFVPVSEDWHTKVCFLQVLWKRFYSKRNTFTEPGTLAQLQSLINRSNVPSEPKKNVNAAQDFIQVVTKGHVIAAALVYLGMECTTAELPPQVARDLVQASTCNRKLCYNNIVRRILDRVVMLPKNPGHNSVVDLPPDGVLYYASELLTFGLLYEEFEDAIKEGDGTRVERCWKFFLLIFKASNRSKYALEAITLLTNIQTLTPRLGQQLIWSRFVNTHGKPGHNIPCDLHIEHLNRTAKEALAQQSNRNPKSVERVGNCLGFFRNVCKQFDLVTNTHHSSGKHTQSSEGTDLNKIVEQLISSRVFMRCHYSRSHASFKTCNGVPLAERIDADKFFLWMNTHIRKIQTHSMYTF